MARNMKSMGRKYVQDNCFKSKEKEHHEIVISDEVVRNSKLYRLLKEKIEIMEYNHNKEMAALRQVPFILFPGQRTHDH